MTNGWVPTAEVIERARVTGFGRAHNIDTFDELLQRSIDDPAWFWDAAVKYLQIPFTTPYDTVLDESSGPAWSRWFVAGQTNLAAMCIDRWVATTPDATAIRWHGEDGSTANWTFAQLHAQTEGVAAALRERGVVMGDRVAIFMPMIPEAVVSFLAVAKTGAVAVPLFSGFGAEAIRVRLVDSEATVVLTADGTFRRGNPSPMAPVAFEAAALAPSVHTVAVVPRLGSDVEATTAGVGSDGFDIIGWPDPLEVASTTVPVPSDHELLLAYTSGTTGLPKGAVHVHGGLPIKVTVEGAFQHDIGAADTLLWFSDMGWIMGPYQIVAGLGNGACLCLVEGTPDHPGPDRLWGIVEQSRVTVLGISPTLVRSLMPHGDEPVTSHDLSSLRILGSTGEPWNDDPWQWYFEVVGRGLCPVINMSGGTEVGGALLSPHPVQQIPPGSLVGPCLGLAVDVYDDDGKPVRGRVGELVNTRSWPGMTKGLYRDPARFEATYWSRWPDVWVQGDWASVDANGVWFLHGRSDDTIMIAGKRLGPIEPESVLVSHPAVVEAAAIGIPHDVKGEALVVFVVVVAGSEATDALAGELKQFVGSKLGSSFRPSEVIFTDALPKTRSNKVMRRALRAEATGEDPGDLSSLDDPASLLKIREALQRRKT